MGNGTEKQKKSAVSVTHGSYKGLDAIAIENGVIRAVLVPELGAKTVSLFHKPTGMEFLYVLDEPLKRSPYDGDYLQSEMCGIDEMFPTISECYYEKKPWQGGTDARSWRSVVAAVGMSNRQGSRDLFRTRCPVAVFSTETRLTRR